MSRRPGQNGRIEKSGNAYYARFWLDEPGKDRRTYKRVRICPATDPGLLNPSQRKRRLREIVAEHDANSAEVVRAADAASLSITFEQQAETWLQSVQTRKRRPIRPRTAEAWTTYLKYINTVIGQMQLADINNRSMKTFVATMAAEKTKTGEPRFSPKSIESYLAIIKMVVASVLNDKDEPMFLVRWNHEVIDLPVVKGQNAPSFTAAEIETIISKAEGQDRLLYAFLAGSGLRIGEAFALTVSDIQGTVVNVRQSAWEGTMTDTKTDNGRRDVDIHSSLADALRDHIGDRTTGLVFPSERGTPLRKSNLLRRSLHPILEEMGKDPCGFHAFRRFRVGHLRKQHVPEILLRWWIGHSTVGITDRYGLEGVIRDTLFRTITAQKAALGFTVPRVAPIAPKAASGAAFVSA
jgi:integrase